MKAGKKLLCLILSAAMIFGSIPAGVMAEELAVLEAEDLIEYDDLSDMASQEDLIILEEDQTLAIDDEGYAGMEDDLISDIEEIVIEPENQLDDGSQTITEEESEAEIQDTTEEQSETETQTEAEECTEAELESESESEFLTEFLIEMESLEEMEMFSAGEEPSACIL